MLAEHLAQCPVQNVCRCVIATSCVSVGNIDFHASALPGGNGPANDFANVLAQARERKHGVEHFYFTSRSSDGANVANLTTAFGIERSDIQEYIDVFLFAILHRNDGEHIGFACCFLVADKLGNAMSFHDVAICLDGGFTNLCALASTLCAIALSAHFLFEARNVYADVAFTSNFLRELEWKAIRVVQQKG